MLTDLIYRVRALFDRKRMEDDLEAELRFHLESLIEKHVGDGMTPATAARRARIELGGITQIKEECRQSWGVRVLDALARDIHYALRVLGRSPGFSTIIVLSLVLGIGANTAIFTLMEAALWRLLPVQDPEDLLVVGRQVGTEFSPGFHYLEYSLLGDTTDVATVAGYAHAMLNVASDGAVEPAVEGQLVSGSYFGLLGVDPMVGRAIGPEDDRLPGGHPVAMLSAGYWKRRFAGDPAIVGSTIRIFGTPFTVIGVTREEFFGTEIGRAPEIFVPMMMQSVVMPSEENLLANPRMFRTWIQTLARVKPGVGRQQALAIWNSRLPHDEQLKALDRNYAFQPERRRTAANIAFGQTASVSPLRQRLAKPLLILMGLTALVLLIACMSSANLMLCSAAARRPEFAIRLALGASRGGLVRQLLVESLILAFLGCIGGLLLARAGTHLLVSYVSVGRSALVLDLSPNSKILLFTTAVTVLTAVLFGLAPSLKVSRTRLAPFLQNLEKAGAGSHGGRGAQPILVAVQIAMSVILLVGAGLFARSLQALAGKGEGQSPHQVLVTQLEPRGSNQRVAPGASAQLDQTYRELMGNVATIPGVVSVSMAQGSPTAPLGRSGAPRLTVPLPSGEQLTVPVLKVYPDYFRTVGVPLVAGRDFNAADLGQDAQAVCIVNEAFVQQAFAGENPLGKPCVVSRRYNSRTPEPFSIVGVVGDSRFTNPHGVSQPIIYMTFLQALTSRGQMVLHVRSSGDARIPLPSIRGEIARVDPFAPVLEIRTLEEEMDGALVQQRLIGLLTALFAGLALLLACVGIYGLVNFSVSQRTRELGIRMALGSRRRSVKWLVIKEALIVVAVGTIVGIPAAIVAARIAADQIPGLLFGPGATDPPSIVWSAAIFLVVAAISAYLPARRASHVEPMATLRV